MGGIHPSFRLMIYLAIAGLGILLVAQPQLVSRAHPITVARYALLIAPALIVLLRFVPGRIVVGDRAVTIWFFPGRRSFRLEDISLFSPSVEVTRHKHDRKVMGFAVGEEDVGETRTPVIRVTATNDVGIIRFNRSKAAEAHRDRLVSHVLKAIAARRPAG